MFDHFMNAKNITAVLCAALLAFCVLMAQGCTREPDGNIMDGDGYIRKYVTIDAAKAKEMIDTEEVIIVDVRTRQEYAEKHIPDAINVPLESITGTIPAELEGKDVPILIYCRTGRRSKQAAELLFDVGCSNLYDFGGIESWPYETVSSEEEALVMPVLILDRHEKSEKDGIVLEVTDYSGGILTARISNESDEVFEYGAAYELNVRENDEWVPVNWKEPMSWIAIAYVLSPGESQEFTCDLSFFEKIDSGFYQLVKGGLSTEFSLVYTE